MPAATIKRALISVYDKTGIVDFARVLVSEFGIEIISTGGTAALLKENGIPVTLVEEVTGFVEMLDGRVKTLHPKIHAAILADRDNPEHVRQLKEQGIDPIDMVVVNLYPFEQTTADPNCTIEQAIDMIDIGGPCLIRAAAKNQKHVLVVYDPEAYEETLDCLRGLQSAPDEYAELCIRYAAGAFELTTCYDAMVARWVGKHERLRPQPWFEMVPMKNWGALRYGENPHQRAAVSRQLSAISRQPFDIRHSTFDIRQSTGEMSFNNFVDASAALDLCEELTFAHLPSEGTGAGSSQKAAVCLVKHTNACGAAVEAEQVEAYRKSYLGDPNAAMGGILAVDFSVTAPFAEAVMDTYSRWGKEAGAGAFFLEVWVAPSFDDDAVQAIRSSKKWGRRVRLLDVGGMNEAPGLDEMDFKPIAGGMVMQNRDIVGLNESQWKIVTKRGPTDSHMADLRLAWLVCKHTKSNAITICKNGMLIGNGAGQMSRVMSCRVATWLAAENGHAELLLGSVAASDGFFPFADGPELLMDAGVRAIIQPGGSKGDSKVIAACEERDVAMIFTGTRHFRH